MNDGKQHRMKPLGAGDPIRHGPYRVLGVLGEGGMGKVHFGREDGGRTAVVKVLLPELAHDLHLVQRFLREGPASWCSRPAGTAPSAVGRPRTCSTGCGTWKPT
ncbi:MULTISPECIES: hypothetical protein [unclassified Streptomyces]|uniref:hypothetical protein n=1 Tax=unclassified Streptomyces TaxID=2593676 RepID=UPI0035E13E5B